MRDLNNAERLASQPASTGDPAARPSEPSAPPVELPGPTGEGSSGHSWVEPSAPQTSAEPCPICGSTKSPHAVGLSCHIPTPIREINECHAAPQPVSGDAPDSATFGSVTCSNAAEPLIEPDQPSPMIFAPKLAGDAPKVEELADDIFDLVAERFDSGGKLKLSEIEEALRPYFPPASQTPDYPKYLKWALDYIANGADYSQGETPIHDCEFSSNPEKGACAFHENFFEAVFALTYAATPASTAAGTEGYK